MALCKSSTTNKFPSKYTANGCKDFSVLTKSDARPMSKSSLGTGFKFILREDVSFNGMMLKSPACNFLAFSKVSNADFRSLAIKQ